MVYGLKKDKCVCSHTEFTNQISYGFTAVKPFLFSVAVSIEW